MLTLHIPRSEKWNETDEKFEYGGDVTIQLVHTLKTISEWESVHHKAFLKEAEKTSEEMLDYIRIMTVTKDVDPSIFNWISNKNVDEINAYLEDSQSATNIPTRGKGRGISDVVTSDLIYYWMTLYHLPFEECQNWHLGRLLSVLEVCNFKATPPKKRKARDIMSDMEQKNNERRKMLNSKG